MKDEPKKLKEGNIRKGGVNDHPASPKPENPSGSKPMIKDSGKRQEFSTGAVRDITEGKGRFDLLPPKVIARLARHFEGGAKKYGKNNWCKGMPLSRYFDSAMRHAFQYLNGQTDEDHLIATIWNFCCLYETKDLIDEGKLPKDLDDLPYG